MLKQNVGVRPSGVLIPYSSTPRPEIALRNRPSASSRAHSISGKPSVEVAVAERAQVLDRGERPRNRLV